MFRVVSYNIRLGLDSSLARIAEILANLRPDIICLQEVGNNWVMGEKVDMTATIADGLGLAYGLHVSAIVQDGGEYGIALLSKHKIVVEDRQFLPQVEDEPRVLVTARIESPDGPVRLITSHVSVVPRDRLDQCARIADWVSERAQSEPLPTLLVGDLNCELGSAELDELIERTGLRCAITEALDKHPPSFPTEQPEVAIDHILIDRSFFCVLGGVDTVAGSDHLPVLADLEVL